MTLNTHIQYLKWMLKFYFSQSYLQSILVLGINRIQYYDVGSSWKLWLHR
jgi:hypothetical protein